ncbi:hypothetical protein EDD17DRAFT_227382 [Pisolithus thermaeus]|nr:hypothetical protein EDD17DRAFT_227382 [Pisolithus thermaeus]
MCSFLILAMVFVPTLSNITPLSHLYAMSIALCCILCVCIKLVTKAHTIANRSVPRGVLCRSTLDTLGIEWFLSQL